MGILFSGWLIAYIVGYFEYDWFSLFVPSISVLIASSRIDYIRGLKE